MNTRQLKKRYIVLELNRQDLLNLGFTKEQVAGLTEADMRWICMELEVSLAGDDDYWNTVRTSAATVFKRKEQANLLT